MPRLPKEKTTPLTNSHSLGQSIARHRKSKGLSQKELGVLVGLSRTGVSGIESGKNKAYADTIAKIAKALEIPIEELLELEPNPDAETTISLRFTRRIRELEQLPETKKKAILKILDDLIRANS